MVIKNLRDVSNNIFGVSMTLLATHVPLLSNAIDKPIVIGSLGDAWGQFHGLVLSFAVAAIYWLSHMRRLSLTGQDSRRIVLGNFLLLFFIVTLPLTTKLYSDANTPGSSALYGANLAMLAIVNSALWYGAAQGQPDKRKARRQLYVPLLAAGLFSLTEMLILADIGFAQLLWLGAFPLPLLDSVFTKHLTSDTPERGSTIDVEA